MIQTFTSNRANQPLDEAVLPGTPPCRNHLLNPQRLDSAPKLSAVAGVTVTNQIPWSIPLCEGLYRLISVDFHVPLLWKVYPGNQHDSQTFAQVLQELTTRYQALARDCQSMTLVLHKGNNSASNQEILDASGLHFVGSLVPTHYADLLAIPRKQFTALADPRLQPTQAYRLTRTVGASSVRC